MNPQQLFPHLFRQEFSRIVSVLVRHFGFDNIQTAEDIASETFLAAYETWPYKGTPENPPAWLHTVAKNKAKNFLQRKRLYIEKIQPEIGTEESVENEIDLSEKNISDSQLQMLFAICHPGLAPEAQIGLALRILCGFGIDEIATAFLTNKETINKRLFRAKEKLRTEKHNFVFPPPAALENRLQNVLTTLYLLFSEGYYSENKDAVLREDLCLEAMRLTYLLLENEQTNLPEVNALLALMCFHASRFAARRGENGEMILYDNQNEEVWDRALIAKGAELLNRASTGNTLSRYHLEAGIAYQHTIKTDSLGKWENILQLYNRLLQMAYSPVAALNRTYAFSKVYGKEKAILEAEKLQLTGNHFYFTLLGELYSGISNRQAKAHFEQAFLLAKTSTDKQTIQRKIDDLLTD